MNFTENLHRIAQSLSEIDTNLGFEEQVEEAALRLCSYIDTLMPSVRAHESEDAGAQGEPPVSVHFDYPYLRMGKHVTTATEGDGCTREACLLLANHHLHLVHQERERAQQSIHEFLHPLSHYMKSPLTAILGYASLLEDELQNTRDEEIMHYIRRIDGNTKLLVKMIDDLLYLSRLSREDMEELSVSELVSEAMKSLHQRNAGGSVDIHIQDPVPNILMNKGHAVTLFTQLLGNAYRYAQQHPTVHIGYRNKEFFIEDNGKGISQDNLLKVFRIFFTTNSKETGSTGAGLYIVKKILDLYGGSIRIESSNGRGTTVYFRTKTKA
jgi:signal transduction histidine kinase